MRRPRLGIIRFGQKVYLEDSPDEWIANEVAILIRQLRDALPDWEFEILSPAEGQMIGVRTHGERGINPDQTPDRVDALLCILTYQWMVSQRIPKRNGAGLRKPLQQSLTSFAPQTRMVNCFQDAHNGEGTVLWLTTDVRSVPQTARDIKWPMREVLSQHTGQFVRSMFRYGDPQSPPEESDIVDHGNGHWSEVVRLTDIGADRIMLELHDEPPALDGRERRSGIVGTDKDRRHVFLSMIPPGWEVWGKWPTLQVEQPAPHDVHRRWRSTFLFPPKQGCTWRTLKILEAYAAGCVVFLHPDYDKAGTVPVYDRDWQTVDSPEDLAGKTQLLYDQDDIYAEMARWQRRVFEATRPQMTHVAQITRRLEGGTTWVH